MSTRLLLEGGDLPELMVHVRAEFGPHARIVSAERIRSGGLAGFFARERYELTIDVPDEPVVRPRAARRPPARAVGLDALLAAADAAEVLGATESAGPDEPAPVPSPAPEADAPVDDTPHVSTGAESFATVLDQMRSMAGGHTLTADIDVPAPEARVFSPLAPPAASAPVVAPRRPAPISARGGLLELGIPEHLLAHVGATGPALLSDLLVHVPQAPELPRAPGTVIVVVGAPGEAEAVAGQLAERLRQSRSAVVVAGNVAGQADVGASRERRIATAASAARWRSRGPDGGQVGVVALGVGPEAGDRANAAAILEALAPHQVWGVIDARTKTRDSARWLGDVGARRAVDVLAVRGAFEAAQPGTVLDLGVPVAWIDGIPATTVAWAAALSQRLGPGARWD